VPAFKTNIERKALFVDCSKRGMVVVAKHGQVFGCGDNRFNQIGVQSSEKYLFELSELPEFPHIAQKVAAGLKHTLIEVENGNLYAIGDNSQGNLGQGHKYSSDSPLKVHGLSGVKIKEIAAGRHSAVVTETGQLFVWGPALDPSRPILSPQELRADRAVKTIAVGEHTSALINQDGHLYTWGLSNSSGQLGIRNEDEQQNLPVLVTALCERIASTVAVGLNFCIALGQDCSAADARKAR